MKPFTIGLLALLLAPGCVMMNHERSHLQVGAASVAVSPPNGTLLAGYDPARTSQGVHDDLYAKAVVLDDGATPLALVVVDCIGLQYGTACEIRKAASYKINGAIPPERIVVQSTHTHSGPDVIGLWGSNEKTTGFNPEYVSSLVAKASDQVVAAYANRQPARMLWGRGTCAGWAVNDSEPGHMDPSVNVLQFQTLQGKSLATLTSFACHPTVLDNENRLVTADWPGAFYKRVDSSLGGVNMYLQGAVGAWIQPETPERTFALADKYGMDLAEKVLAALPSACPVAGTPILFASKPFQMPIENPKFAAISQAGLTPRNFDQVSVATEVVAFSVGSAQFATHPGETAPVFAEQTRALMEDSGGPKIILGLGLDEIGYICPRSYFENPKAYGAAEYITGMSPGISAGDTMMKALSSILPLQTLDQPGNL